MKTCEEWSLEFDLLYNNIASDQAPGLEEYEKSVFLTRAQEAVVLGLYRGSFGDAFESTEEVTAYLDVLVKQADFNPVEEEESVSGQKLSDSSVLFENPEDMLLRTWESCSVTTECGETGVPVIPVTQDEYWRTVRNPFKKQNGRRVLRLAFAADGGEAAEYGRQGYTELISDYPVSKYTVRYLARPEPIILVDLPDALTINGSSAKATCKLEEALHQTILTEAVRLAKAAWLS